MDPLRELIELSFKVEDFCKKVKGAPNLVTLDDFDALPLERIRAILVRSKEIVDRRSSN